MQYGFYFDQSRCTGCTTCLVACKDWNGLKPGNLQYRKIITIEEGERYPAIKVSNTVFSCNHCEKPACLSVCPVEAISKRSDGIVLVDRDKCIGCGSCAEACPFGAPKYGDDVTEPESKKEWNTEHPMQKCTFCADRIDDGKPPVCVSSCLVRALDFGTMDELKKKYPASVDKVKGFPSDKYQADGKTKLDKSTNPSIVFRPSSR
jgi:anaerobic dimethyl sulfoxide reductase subunit B (iron-sulfur subunit)